MRHEIGDLLFSSSKLRKPFHAGDNAGIVIGKVAAIKKEIIHTASVVPTAVSCGSFPQSAQIEKPLHPKAQGLDSSGHDANVVAWSHGFHEIQPEHDRHEEVVETFFAPSPDVRIELTLHLDPEVVGVKQQLLELGAERGQ